MTQLELDLHVPHDPTPVANLWLAEKNRLYVRTAAKYWPTAYHRFADPAKRGKLVFKDLVSTRLYTGLARHNDALLRTTAPMPGSVLRLVVIDPQAPLEIFSHGQRLLTIVPYTIKSPLGLDGEVVFEVLKPRP